MKKIIVIVFLCITSIITAPAWADITSVTVTPATPTALSNGNSYYLAGRQYTFIVQASDPLASVQTDWDYLDLFIENGANSTSVRVDIDGGNTATVTSGDSSIVPGVINSSTGYSNITYTINLTFAWDTDEFAASPVSAVRAVVREINGAPSIGTDTKTFNFGVCSSIRVANFAQNQNGVGVVPGVAADGYINPWHSSFRVTGTIVYNVTGASIADRLDLIDNGEITSTTLYTDGATTYLGGDPGWREDDAMADNCSYTVPAGNGTLVLGNRTWTIRVTMTTPGFPALGEISANSLTVNCDRIRIDTIAFINGGGTNSPYYRSVNVPGTQIQISASRQSGAAGVLAMIGNTTITVRNLTNTQDFTLLIADGAFTGVGNVPNPSVLPGNGATDPRTYQVISITGSAFDNEQNILVNPGSITQTPPNPVILWDRNDPPGNNGAPSAGQTPFTDEPSFGYTVTATSFTLNWQPVTALPNDPPYDADFYTYRIYYKLSSSSTWIIVDRGTPNYGPAQIYDLSNPATTTATIPGLQPLTNYDYFMTAVDVFGQEVEHPIPNTLSNSDALYDGAPSPIGYGQLTTNPTSIEASVTDGITNYTFAQFSASINASTRPLRKSSLRVTIVIISAGDQPDSVNLIVAQDDGAGNGLPAGPLYPLSGAPLYEKISCAKSAPNTWQGYIPSTNQFLTEGNYCRFIIESIRNSVPTYSDVTNNGDANDHEYNFLVQTPTTFTPWPTRVLNNVITDKHPLCYPSYYLSDDAYVTIKAYDVKGRPVATLLDNGFRKGGQNIKEGGWSGENKARRKLGVGLYYLRFEAKRARDGKMILNQTEKVVIAK